MFAFLFDSVGFGEWFVLLAVVLVVVGPRNLPSTARKLGQYYSKFRRAADSFKRQILEMDTEFDRAVSDATRDFSDEMRGMTDEIKSAVDEVKAVAETSDVGGSAAKADSAAAPTLTTALAICSRICDTEVCAMLLCA